MGISNSIYNDESKKHEEIISKKNINKFNGYFFKSNQLII